MQRVIEDGGEEIVVKEEKELPKEMENAIGT